MAKPRDRALHVLGQRSGRGLEASLWPLQEWRLPRRLTQGCRLRQVFADKLTPSALGCPKSPDSWGFVILVRLLLSPCQRQRGKVRVKEMLWTRCFMWP
ncbi:hypothetical protein EMIT047CA2_170012 [Pseudomonas soli]